MKGVRTVVLVGVCFGAGCGDDEPDPPVTPCDGEGAPQAVFNTLWHELDRNYALFDIRLPNDTWAAVAERQCEQIDVDMDDDALFDVLIETVQFLDDGHVQIEAPALDRDGDGWADAYPHYDALYDLELGVQDHYADAPLSWAAGEWVAWTTIGDVGYLSLTSMEDLTDSGDEDDDARAVDEAMAEVMADLDQTRAVVVDVRANEGGWDLVALAFARWFSGPRTLAWSEQVRDGPAHDDFSAWRDTDVEASVSSAYAGPVVVLTSGGTFSAGEVFVLAMRVRDDVTVLGEPTSGHLSDAFEAALPNGWSFTYSGERYRAADGEIYEAVGIPVDIAVDLGVDALPSGSDAMLEAALSHLGG